jgi:hypothetical protein
MSRADASVTVRVIAPGHLVTNRSEFRGSQQAARHRKQILVLKGNVPAIYPLQGDEVFPERSCVAGWQRSLPQPSATQRLNSVVVILGDTEIRFEPFDHPDGRLGVGIL